MNQLISDPVCNCSMSFQVRHDSCRRGNHQFFVIDNAKDLSDPKNVSEIHKRREHLLLYDYYYFKYGSFEINCAHLFVRVLFSPHRRLLQINN